MGITCDPAKNVRNIKERELSFDRAEDFDFGSAIVKQDTRKNYGEMRYRALGLLDDRVHALVFVPTATGIRVVSFRKANRREIRKWQAREW